MYLSYSRNYLRLHNVIDIVFLDLIQKNYWRITDHYRWYKWFYLLFRKIKRWKWSRISWGTNVNVPVGIVVDAKSFVAWKDMDVIWHFNHPLLLFVFWILYGLPEIVELIALPEIPFIVSYEITSIVFCICIIHKN